MTTPMIDENQDIERIDDSEDEANPIETIEVRKFTSGTRLDKYLCARFPRMSRTNLQKLIKDGDVTVNGFPTKPSYEPTKGDVIQVVVPPPVPLDVIPENIPVEILYEDDHFLAINKQTGIICHPSGPGQTGTLANALAYYAETLSSGSDPFRPGIIHRLDKNTTGVMLIAKTEEAHWRIALQFEKRTVHKMYFGILEGNVQLDGDIIDQPLASHPVVKDRYIVGGKVTHAQITKNAVTRYEVQERFVGFTTVHMFPKTGRTHQLRVHMSSIGHPMLGDTLYGGHFLSEKDLSGEGSMEPLIKFQSLHARRIRIVHPIENRPIAIEAPIPPHLESILELLRKHRARET